MKFYWEYIDFCVFPMAQESPFYLFVSESYDCHNMNFCAVWNLRTVSVVVCFLLM